MGDATAGDDGSDGGDSGEGEDGAAGQTTGNSGDNAGDNSAGESEGAPTTGEAPSESNSGIGDEPGSGDNPTPGEVSSPGAIGADPDFSNPASMAGVGEGRDGVDATVGPEVDVAPLIDPVPLPTPAPRDWIDFWNEQEQKGQADPYGIPPAIYGMAEEFSEHPSDPNLAIEGGYVYAFGPNGEYLAPYGMFNYDPALAPGGDELNNDPSAEPLPSIIPGYVPTYRDI